MMGNKLVSSMTTTGTTRGEPHAAPEETGAETEGMDVDDNKIQGEVVAQIEASTSQEREEDNDQNIAEAPQPPANDAIDTCITKEATLPSNEKATTSGTTTKNIINTDHDVSWMTDKERNELSALQLRFSFQDVNFFKVYHDLTRAGWVHFTNRRLYLPPDVDKETKDKTAFLSANEVAQHLDYGSPLAYEDSEVNHKTPPRLGVGQEERWRRLRDDAIYHLFQSQLKKERGRTKPSASGDNDKENNDKENTTTTTAIMDNDDDNTTNKSLDDENTINSNSNNNAKKNKKPQEPRKQPSRRAHNNTTSVTEADRGAGQYLNKANIQSKQSRLLQKKHAQQQHRQSLLVSSSDDLPSFERLSLEECMKQGQEGDQDEEDVVEQFEAAYHDQFAEWQFLLATNHSLLLYGFGSKRKLLNDFCQSHLRKEGYVLMLDGFDPEITVEAILDLLVALFLDGLEPSLLYHRHHSCLPGMEEEESTEIIKERKDPKTGTVKHVVRRKIRDPVDRARAIARAIAKAQAQAKNNEDDADLPIYLVLHNIEGLRNRLAQEVLSTLVAHGQHSNNDSNAGDAGSAIRLVASFDHVDTPALLWSVQTSANYRWIWKEVHTYRPYTEELIMLAPDEIQISQNGKKRRASGGGGGLSKRQQKLLIQDGEGADRVMEVLRNLATRYTEVMHNLANLQLEARQQHAAGNTAKIHWVDAAQLLQRCLNTCTVKSDQQLRTFLDELDDHELVVVQKQGSTSVMVRIPYTDDKLHEILDYEPSKT